MVPTVSCLDLLFRSENYSNVPIEHTVPKSSILDMLLCINTMNLRDSLISFVFTILNPSLTFVLSKAPLISF